MFLLYVRGRLPNSHDGVASWSLTLLFHETHENFSASPRCRNKITRILNEQMTRWGGGRGLPERNVWRFRPNGGKECARDVYVRRTKADVSSSFQQELTRNRFEVKADFKGAGSRAYRHVRTHTRLSTTWPHSFPVTSPFRDTTSRYYCYHCCRVSCGSRHYLPIIVVTLATLEFARERW